MRRTSTIVSFLVAVSLLGILLHGCGGDDPTPPDTTPPFAVDDLSVSGTTASTATLEWTAPGDDGDEGRASAYDIRYSQGLITELNWSAASVAAGEPTPSTANAGESFTITGLAPETRYFFALKTEDDESNWSAISNVDSGVTSDGLTPEDTLDLDGYWRIRFIDDIDLDPGDDGDCVRIEHAGDSVAFESLCFENGIAAALIGDSIYGESWDEEVVLTGHVSNDSCWGTYTIDDGEEESWGTWFAVPLSSEPDEYDCVEALASVAGVHCDDGRYILFAQIDDYDSLVVSAYLTGTALAEDVPLSDTIYPEESDEWWTDLCDSNLVLAVGTAPALPIEFTIHVEFLGAADRDIVLPLRRFIDADCNSFSCGCSTVFFDDFESMTLNPELSLHTGDASVYHLTGDDIAMDDSGVYTDGPFFVHADSLENDHLRFTVVMRTQTMNGEVELALALRVSDEGAYVFGLWDGLRIIRDAATVTELAREPSFSMGDAETLEFIAEYDSGHLTFTVKPEGGSAVVSITATDPSPLPPGRCAFGGEIDGTTGEYLYAEQIKIETCE